MVSGYPNTGLVGRILGQIWVIVSVVRVSDNFRLQSFNLSMAVTEKLKTIAGSPELDGTCGAQHENVPEQSHGVQEPSHGAPGGVWW